MPVCLPVVVRLFVGQTVRLLWVSPSICPSNAQTGFPSLRPPQPVFTSSASQSVYPLLAQASCSSVFQFVCVPSSAYLAIGPSCLPIYLPVHPTLLFPTPTSLHVWSWVHSSPKPTSLCHQQAGCPQGGGAARPASPGAPASPPAPVYTPSLCDTASPFSQPPPSSI